VHDDLGEVLEERLARRFPRPEEDVGTVELSGDDRSSSRDFSRLVEADVRDVAAAGGVEAVLTERAVGAKVLGAPVSTPARITRLEGPLTALLVEDRTLRYRRRARLAQAYAVGNVKACQPLLEIPNGARREPCLDPSVA